jgi:hypothetical protein
MTATTTTAGCIVRLAATVILCCTDLEPVRRYRAVAMLASTEKRVTARDVSPVKGSAGSFVTGAWLNTPDFLRAGDGSAVCTNEEKEVFLFLKEEKKKVFLVASSRRINGPLSAPFIEKSFFERERRALQLPVTCREANWTSVN